MSESNRGNNFIVQGTILGIASIIVRLLGLLYQMPVAHIIGDMGNGYYGYAYNVYAVILLISSFSIPTAVSKLISTSITAKKYKEAQKIFKASMIIVGSFSGLCAILTFIFAPELLTMFSENQKGAVMALRVLSPVIFLSGILGVLRGYFQGYNTMVPTSISQIIEGILNAIVSIVAALIIVIPYKTDVEKTAVYGAAGSTLGTAAGVLFGLFFMLFLYSGFRRIIRKKVRRDKHQVTMEYSEIAKLIVLTVAPVLFSSLIFNICPVIDQNLFAGILERKGVYSGDITVLQGIYSVKYLKVVSLPVSIAAALSSAIIPAIVVSVTKNDLVEANRQIDTAMKFTMLIAIPCTVGLAVLAEPIMLLFGRVYTLPIAVHVLIFGSINVIFNCISTLTNAVLQGLDKMKYPVIHGIIAIVVHVIVTAVCLNKGLGIYALLVGGIAFSLVMWVLNALVIYKTTGYSKALGNNFFSILLSALGMGICVFIVYFVLNLVLGDGLEFIGLIVAMIVAFFMYMVLLHLFNAFTEEDYEVLPFGYKIRAFGEFFHLMDEGEEEASRDYDANSRYDYSDKYNVDTKEDEYVPDETDISYDEEDNDEYYEHTEKKISIFKKPDFGKRHRDKEKKTGRSRAGEEMISDDVDIDEVFDENDDKVMSFLKDENPEVIHTEFKDASDVVSDLMSEVSHEHGFKGTDIKSNVSDEGVDLSSYELSSEAKEKIDSMFTATKPVEDVNDGVDASVNDIAEQDNDIDNNAAADNEPVAVEPVVTEPTVDVDFVDDSETNEAKSIKDGLGPDTEPINVEKILRKYQEQEKKASMALSEQQRLNDQNKNKF